MAINKIKCWANDELNFLEYELRKSADETKEFLFKDLLKTRTQLYIMILVTIASALKRQWVSIPLFIIYLLIYHDYRKKAGDYKHYQRVLWKWENLYKTK